MAESGAHSHGMELSMLAGFVAVPPTAVLITLATYQVLWTAGLLPDGAPINSLDFAGSLGTGVGLIAVVMTACAVPAVAWLGGCGPLSLTRLVMLGAVLGNVPFALILLGVVATHVASGTLSTDIGRYWYGWSGAVVRAMMGLICGMGSAAAFWYVGVRGTRPVTGRQ